MDQIKEQIEILEDEINAELDLYRDRDDVIGASNHCFNRILEIDRDGAGTALTANMRRYLYAIHMLQLQMEAGHLKPHEMDQVVRIAETSLQLAGIKEGSRRGYLHEKIHHCKSNLLQQGGYPLGAQWELLIGKRFLSTDIIRIDSAISETMTLFHMGYAYEAGRGFEKLLKMRLEREQKVFLELQAIKAARLSGRTDEASERIARMLHDPSLDDETRELLQWEKSWLAMNKTGRIDAFARMISARREYPDEPYLSLIFLLYYCHPNAIGQIKDLPSLTTVRKRQAKRRSQADKLLFEILELFPLLYDTQVAIKVRLVRVTGLLDRVHVLHPEYQLLFFLGLARWAHRFKQKGFIHLARNKYLSLSQLMSNHKTDDVLEMIADMRTTGSALWFLNEATDDQEAQACPFAFTAKAHPSIAPTAAARGQYGRRFSIRRQ